MTVLWIIGGIVALILIAAVGEAWLKRGKYCPLASRLSARRRRYDDPNRPDICSDHHVINVPTHRNSTGETAHKSWSVSKNPNEYAKAMMPETSKGRSK